MRNFGGLILAGGKSSRMGQDKGSMDFMGRPMIQYAIDVLNKAGISDIQIVTNKSDLYSKLNYPIISDIFKNNGPLGGLHAGLTYAKQGHIFVLPCDTPLIDVKVIQTIMKLHEDPLTVASYHDRIHPLIGIYNRSILPQIMIQLNRGDLKLQHLINQVNGTVLNLDSYLTLEKANSFRNFNSASEVDYYMNK